MEKHEFDDEDNCSSNEYVLVLSSIISEKTDRTQKLRNTKDDFKKAL